MATLNEHIIDEIFSFVHESSFPTIKVLLLVNRTFYDIARPYLYRYIAINITGKDIVEEINSLLYDPSYSFVATSIHELRIESSLSPPVQNIWSGRRGKILGALDKNHPSGHARSRKGPFDWTLISALISKTTQLRSITFACIRTSLPLSLLQSIHDYPTVIALHVTSWWRASPDVDHTDPIELALTFSPSLRSFRTIIYDPMQEPTDLRLPAIARIARSAPKLETFALEVGYGGCVHEMETSDEIEAYKALAAKFEDRKRPKLETRGIRNLMLHGGNLLSINLGDLSHVSTLDYRGNLSPDMFKSLPALVNLTLRGDFGINTILMACPPLQSLKITRWRDYFSLDVLGTHHPSLKALSLHEVETSSLSNPRPTLQHEDLLRIASQNAHLQALSIDIDFAEDLGFTSDHLSVDSHIGTYSIFRSFRKLQKLHLNFNLGIATYANRRFSPYDTKRQDIGIPRATPDFVREVWHELNHCRSPSEKLVELRLSQGEAGRSGGAGPRRVAWVTWEERSHHWFLATRGDGGLDLNITNYTTIPDFEYDVWRKCADSLQEV